MKTKVWQEIRGLSDAELGIKLEESKEKMFRMKFKHASTPLKNGLEIRTTRKLIAKINTLIKERALKQAKKDN
jgi:large subunit ribosomal protein L29